MGQQRPRGLEEVLLRAASDSGLLEELVADREAAVRRLGIELTDSEWSALRAMPPDRLRHAVQNIDPASPLGPEEVVEVVDAPARGIRADLPSPRGLFQRLFRKRG